MSSPLGQGRGWEMLLFCCGCLDEFKGQHLNDTWRLGIAMQAASSSAAAASGWHLHPPFSLTFFSVVELLVDRFLKLVCQPVFVYQIF